LFRPTKPRAKLLQNLLQSNEIRFGDAFETAIEQYLIGEGWESLPKNITACDGEALNVDQLLRRDGKIAFIEQKVRDDHDSTKKRGQVSNFEKKLEALLDLYGNTVKQGFFYFIDPSLVKNKNFYEAELQKLQRSWGVELMVSYGKDMFARLNCAAIWDSILSNLEQWRHDIPDLPEVNFDVAPQESAAEIKDLPFNVWRKLFADKRVCEQILPVIFPTGETLRLVLPEFAKNNAVIAKNIETQIKHWLNHVK
jgi:Holliday junction resolvase-like predicted endonuclease